MVSIEIDKNDLLNLIGEKLTDEKIEETLFLLKVEPTISKDSIICELNPDRPDLFSVEGIVRMMKGFLNIEKGIKKYDIADSDVILKREKADVRPFIACAIIENVELTDYLIRSLMQIQEKLHDSIGRKRKKVAIGVHDFDKIKPPLVYKDVEDEAFTPLGETKLMNVKQMLAEHPKGKKFADLLEDKYPMIYDKDGVISFPPIINSERTKLTENTKNLFIDVTGTDEKAVNTALNILVCNIAERTGKISTVKVSGKKTPELEPREMTIEVENVDKLLGLGLTESDVASILERMRYGVSKLKGGKIDISIPPYRYDILHTVDIVEDIAIGYGFNKIEPVLPKIATVGNQLDIEKTTKKTRELMVGLGFQEVLNFVLTNRENNFDKMKTDGDAVEILNPVSSEYSICRTWILPSLTKILAANKHREYPQKIFEISDCVLLDEKKETKTKTVRKLSGVISYENANLTEMKSVIETVLNGLGHKYEIKEYKHPSFIESRCGEIIINNEQIGFFGEMNPEILELWGLETPVIGFEIRVD